MAVPVHAISGATGSLGSHIAERLSESGQQVRALVRPTSDTTFLQQLGVEIIEGDLTEPQSAEKLVAGAEVVFHCAAKTGNWGARSEHFASTVETTRHIVDACHRDAHIKRLLHVSSIAVYGHPRPGNKKVSEDDPLGQHLWLWDYYTQAKIESERLVEQLGSRATIIRPTWIYGPRDPLNIPALITAARNNGLWIIGSGNNLLNMVHAVDVADAAIRAANSPVAAGQTYNICSNGELTQRQLMELVCASLNRRPPRRSVPYFVVHMLGFACELWGRVVRQRNAPFVMRHDVSVFMRPVCYSWAKAERELGWAPSDRTAERLAQVIQSI